MPAAVLCLAALCGYAIHGRVQVKSLAELGEPWVPRPEVARLSAAGFHTALADYYWLRAVQIVGSAIRPEAEGTLLGRFIDVVTTVDPWVDHPYRFAAVWLTGSEEDVRQANRMLERSLEYHPEEWRNRFYLGFNHFFYLGDAASAADELAGAIHLPKAPPYLRRLVARLRADSAGLETAAGFLQELIADSDDPWVRAEYEKALAEIQTERLARGLDQARAEYERRAGRDLEVLEDLTQGPHAVLRSLPPEPHGGKWTLAPEDGRIVSSHYGHRYEPHIHPTDRERRRSWLGAEGATP